MAALVLRTAVATRAPVHQATKESTVQVITFNRYTCALSANMQRAKSQSELRILRFSDSHRKFPLWQDRAVSYMELYLCGAISIKEVPSLLKERFKTFFKFSGTFAIIFQS